MYFCTYFDSNYLTKGKVCHYTLMSRVPDATLFVICFDDKTFNEVSTWKNVRTILPADLENFWPDLLKAKSNRQAKEYFATMTPLLPLYIFDKHPEVDLLFYTDADMAFWSDPTEMIQVMGNHSIMVSDHGFEPPRNNVRFNVGILGYRNDDKCKSFLEWWRDRCIEWCYWITTPDGKMADQGYLNKLHEDYAAYNALNCPHPGINLGPWNLAKHFVVEKQGRKIVDGQYNLICYHYHEFRMTGNSYYPTGWPHSANDLSVIFDPYFKLMKQLGYNMSIQKADWKNFEFAKANHELNKSYFQTGEYKNFPSYFKLKEALLWILSENKDNLTMLDVGCGTGWQAEYLRLEGLLERISYTGSDISQHMCDFAAKNCSVAKFMVSNITNDIPGLFDIVSGAAVLELIDDWKLAVLNMIKCSKKWLIFHRMYFTEKTSFIEQVKTYNDVPDMRYHIGLQDLKQVLTDNGFSLVKEDRWHSGAYNMGTFIAKRST